MNDLSNEALETALNYFIEECLYGALRNRYE